MSTTTITSTSATILQESGRMVLTILSSNTAAGVLAEKTQQALDAIDSAADTAMFTAGMYPDTATGLINTVDGEYFNVPSGDMEEFAILYKNVAGAAVEQKRFPGAPILQATLDAAAAAADSESAAAASEAAAAGSSDAAATSAGLADADRIAAEAARDAAFTAAQASGVYMYDTKAAANAAASSLADLTIVEVLADESQSGARTRYRKESGSLVFKINMDFLRNDLADSADTAKGAALVGYDPVDVAKPSTTVYAKLREIEQAYAGMKVKIVAGVVRNYGTLGAPDWRFIEDSLHTKMNCGSVAMNGLKLQINYSSTYKKTISFIAAPDETLAAQGFTVGASVGNGNALIEVGQRLQGFVNLSNGNVTLNSNSLWPASAVTAVVGGDGIVTLTHLSNGGFQSYGFSKEPGSPYRMPMLVFKSISATETKIYPYDELAGYARYDGISWGILTSTISGMSISESGGTVTITHPALSAVHPPQISTRDNGAVIAMPDSYTDTTMTVKFRDFAGGAVSTNSTNMRFMFSRPGRLPKGSAVQGEAYFDLGYASVDMARLLTLGGNIWFIGVFEDN